MWLFFMNLSDIALTGMAGLEGEGERHVASAQPVRACQDGAQRTGSLEGHTTSLIALIYSIFKYLFYFIDRE